MSVEILSSERGAAFFCNTSDWAFGPLMPDADVAEAFLRTFERPDDPRRYSDAELESLWSVFRQKMEVCPAGHLGKVEVENHGDGQTVFTCYQKGCRVQWDLEGNAVVEEDDAHYSSQFEDNRGLLG